jgi:hypothetical protein
MKLYVPYNKINPISPDKDDTLLGLALGTMALGVQPIPTLDKEYVIYTADNNKLPLQVADLISSKGVIIKELPLFIEIENKDDNNAFGILDEEQNVLTWLQWKLSNHTFYEADNRIFIGTNAHTGEDMDWADLLTVRDSLVLPQDLPAITE